VAHLLFVLVTDKVVADLPIEAVAVLQVQLVQRILQDVDICH